VSRRDPATYAILGCGSPFSCSLTLGASQHPVEERGGTTRIAARRILCHPLRDQAKALLHLTHECRLKRTLRRGEGLHETEIPGLVHPLGACGRRRATSPSRQVAGARAARALPTASDYGMAPEFRLLRSSASAAATRLASEGKGSKELERSTPASRRSCLIVLSAAHAIPSPTNFCAAAYAKAQNFSPSALPAARMRSATPSGSSVGEGASNPLGELSQPSVRM